MTYVIDTNFIILWIRKEKAVVEKAKSIGLFQRRNTLVSIVTQAECLSLAKKRAWGQTKIAALQTMFDTLHIIPVAQKDMVNAYVELDTYSQGLLKEKPSGVSARNMGKNDLWIAATAFVTGATLITTDKDFDHLKGAFIDVMYLDPVSLLK